MRIKMLMASALAFAAGLANAGTRTPEQTFTYTLLTHESPGYVVMGAKAVERNPALSTDVLDVVAALLAERSATPGHSPQELDTSAWLIRALGAGRQARHRPAIEQAVAAYRHKKIDKYADSVLSGMTLGDPSSTSTPGIDLADLRVRLQAERDAMRRADPATIPRDIASGTPLGTVLATYGYPDRISENVRTAGYMYVRVDARSLRLHYDGVGMVDVDNGAASGHDWVASRFWPELPNPHPGDRPAEAVALSSGNNRELLGTAMGLVRAGNRDPLVLDAAAERIRQSMGSRDVYEIKALAHLCRLLGASGDQKYAGLLQQASIDGADNALRRHARRGLDDLRGN